MFHKSYCFAIAVTYLGTALIAFFFKFDTLLFLLSYPWNLLLASFLMIHKTPDSIFYFDAGMLMGTFINALIFLKICKPFKKTND